MAFFAPTDRHNDDNDRQTYATNHFIPCACAQGNEELTNRIEDACIHTLVILG